MFIYICIQYTYRHIYLCVLYIIIIIKMIIKPFILQENMRSGPYTGRRKFPYVNTCM